MWGHIYIHCMQLSLHDPATTRSLDKHDDDNDIIHTYTL